MNPIMKAVVTLTLLLSFSSAYSIYNNGPLNPPVYAAQNLEQNVTDELVHFDFLITKVTEDGEVYGKLLEDDESGEGIYLVQSFVNELQLRPDRNIAVNDAIAVYYTAEDAKAELWDEIKGVKIYEVDNN
jgi:hypothetical protein